jgi:hypothetical protein
MRHFVPERRGLLIAVAALFVVVVTTVVAWGGKDDQPTPSERATLVLHEASVRQQRGCDQRPGFTVYTLGERFHGEYATRLGARCETRANETEVFYGPCRDGGESGCGNDISVRSRPVCEHPSELYTIFSGSSSEDLSNPDKITTIRGVPAAIFEEHIVLLTRDTAIIVFADPKIAREAVNALRPATRATATAGSLPKPAATTIDRKLNDLHCPA